MVYTSKSSAKSYPKDKSIYELLFENNHHVSKDFLIYVDAEHPETSYTHEQVRIQILKAAAGLKREFNFQKGDVVAICSPNQVDYPIILHGAVCAGGATATIDQASSPEMIASDLDVVRPKLLITHKDTLDSALSAAKIYGLPETHILMFGEYGIKGIRTVSETLLSGTELATPYRYTPEELSQSPAFLYFTSGTTGRKKAVMIMQSSLAASLHLKDVWGFEGMRALAYTEYHHVSSLLGNMFFFIYFGVTSYVLAHYSLENLCRAVETFKINTTTTQPYIISALAKDELANQYDLSSLKFVVCCGAALDNTVTRMVNERRGIAIFNAYGMTEVLGLFHTDPEVTAANGIGYLAAGFTARIVDDDGNDVAPGDMGELLVHGPTVTKGYYRNPEATAAAIDAEGYLHTGDLVRCNENGMFTYVDRAKDLIKYYLAHIYPSDIENVLMQHPSVSDCAAIGVYTPELTTELPRAYVQLVDGQSYSEEMQQELLEFANSRLCDTKKLRAGVVIVDDFPRTASGKIQRRVLRQSAKDAILV